MSDGAWFARAIGVNLLVSLTIHGLRPIITYRALALGAGPAEIGFLGAAFAVLSLLIAVPAGRWVDRLGEPRLMLGGTIGVAAVALALAASTRLEAIAAATAVLGVGQILVVVSVQTLIANAGDPDGRDARFGVQTVAVSLAQLVGPAASAAIVAGAMATGQGGGALPTVADTNAAFLLGTVASGAASIAAVSLWVWPPRRHARRSPDEPAPAMGSTRSALGRVARTPSVPQALAVSMAVLATVDILVLYLPAFGVAEGLGVETVGLLLAVRAGASMLVRLLMMPLLRRLGRRRLLVGGTVVPALALAALPLVGTELPLLVGLMVVVGAGLGLGQPLTLSWVAGSVAPEIRGTAIGLRLSANRVGQVAVPVGASLVAGAAGLTAIFWLVGALLAVGAGLVVTTDFGDRRARESSIMADG